LAIYITGSLAYDRIMRFPGNFSESILPEHVSILNVSFFIESMDEKLGGNAGNIAYSLALLDEKAIIVSSAGKDFGPYASVLAGLGLSTEGIRIDENDRTAGCYIITDRQNNQITAFHAAAMTASCGYAFPKADPKTDIAIIAPSNPGDMIAQPRFFKANNIRYIYDPAQQIPALDRFGMKAAVEGAFLLIGNDYEITLISELTGYSLDELVNKTVRGVVVTCGEKGSRLHEKDNKTTEIAAVTVDAVADPTGAGDAYRSGLLRGLVADLSLADCCRLGATCAAYCVEKKGTQEHCYTMHEFRTRYEAAFGKGAFPL